MKMPAFVQLFGPLPSSGMNVFTPASWNFLTAVTASTKTFNFQHGFPQATWAVWKHIWTPKNQWARLVHMTDGPASITEIVSVRNPAVNPIVSAFDITSAFNALITAGAYKHLGFQMQGGGQATLYESRLEITFDLG
jgi:hypothetical protein